MSEADFLNAIIYMGRIKIVHIHFEAIMFFRFQWYFMPAQTELKKQKD